MPAGRPTNYNAEIQAKAEKYIVDYKKHKHVIPSIAGLAMVLGISRNTIYDWAKKKENKKFKYTLDQLMTNQECKLLNSGLSGEFNSAITKLALVNHGYSDKKEDDEKEEAQPTEVKIIVEDARKGK